MNRFAAWKHDVANDDNDGPTLTTINVCNNLRAMVKRRMKMKKRKTDVRLFFSPQIKGETFKATVEHKKMSKLNSLDI